MNGCLNFVKGADAEVKSTILGKARRFTLPQELVMEKVIQGIQNPDISWKVDKPVSTWKGVKCEEHGEITSISWPGEGLKGTVAFQDLPQTLLELNLADIVFYCGELENFFEGTVPFDKLPPRLIKFDLGNNLFYGNVNLVQLPESLEDLRLNHNNFSGLVEFHSLPPWLSVLHLQWNNGLYGTIMPNVLPASLQNYEFERTSITVSTIQAD
mmetsp:Transcript_17462/g.24291  ORF Transcript_17462/g.24291 Transcript_17462/m.24291 type:complete len:212 (+) Transcript_17462:52-687(+)